MVSESKVEQYDDFVKIMELAQAGFLNAGNRLARIDFRLSDREKIVHLTADGQSLALRDMEVERNVKGE